MFLPLGVGAWGCHTGRMSEQPLTPRPETNAGEQARGGNELAGDRDALRVRGTVPCGIERAWAFVTVPGWYINDTELRSHTIVSPEPGRHIVTDPVYGEFVFEDLDVVRPTHYVTQGSHSGGDTDAPATILGFELREVGEEAKHTEVIVTETGFDSLGLDDAARETAIRANVDAWVLELRLAAQELARPE